jgi:rubrerythrin
MPAHTIDFAKLSLRDALDLAALVEEEARDRYVEFAFQMETHHTPDAAHFFRFMAANEEKHRVQLTLRREALFPRQPCTVSQLDLFEVEAPEYDEARAYMTARGALTTALRCEEKAWGFFKRALPAAKDVEVKKLFQELLEEELLHQALVKKELEKLPADDAFDAKDFEDHPEAHD